MSLRATINPLFQSLKSRLKQLTAAFQRARTQEVDLSSVKTSFVNFAESLRQRFQRPEISISDLKIWIRLHGRKLVVILGTPLIGIALTILIHHYTSRLTDSISLKPIQLTLIESLVQDSKQTHRTGNSSVAPLTDNDLETMRVILQNRGINPNIMRLNLEQGIRIEIQIDQAPFGQWVAFLEEIAQRWQVYPTNLTLQASEQPEIVSIRSTLQQSQGGFQ